MYNENFTEKIMQYFLEEPIDEAVQMFDTFSLSTRGINNRDMIMRTPK